MPKFRITTLETTTYAYWVEAPDADAAFTDFDPEHGGKELDHTFEVINVEPVEE